MYEIIRPLLFKNDPEILHEKTLSIGKYLSNSWLKKPIKLLYDFNDKRLHSNLFKIDFKNPVGLAAGFDKNGELLDFLPSLGFGFVEIGSITAWIGEGNPKPSIYRYPKEESILNNSGLPNIGADKVFDNLKNKEFKVPVGVNIAKTHNPKLIDEAGVIDMCYSFARLYDLGDYITLNISCPNTVEGRTFENKYALKDLLFEINKIHCNRLNKKPVFLKLSPDLSFKSIDDILEIAEHYGIDGYVLSNTSFKRLWYMDKEEIIELREGGISGHPIKKRSTELIKYVKEQLPHTVIIGSGGIFSAQDTYEKILAGASLVQVYTGLIYEGPGLVKKINKGLVRLLKRDGFSCLEEAVGSK